MRPSQNRLTPSRGGMLEPDPEDPHFVHDEVKELASVAKQVIQQKFQRHGTNAGQVIAGLKQFGVSEQSKKIMQREKAAATMAEETGVYGVWRNENAKHAMHRDFCSRIGPLHICFCGHLLADHEQINLKKKSGPRCTCCSCEGFRYIPNEPEEIGEHWLSRRKEFVPGMWFPKCRCGHASKSHDPGKRGSCRECRSCFGFEGHFACNVCDGRFEDHVTIFESAGERQQEGKSVSGAFSPLHDQDTETKEIVFGTRMGSEQLRGGGHRIAPPPAPAPKMAIQFTGSQASRSQLCTNCQNPFRSETSKFCSHCGAKRPL